MSDSEELTIYHHNGICLVVEMKHIEILGRAVTLSETQFQIMHLLMRKPGRVLSRSDILD